MTTARTTPGVTHLFRANIDLHQLQHWMAETATRSRDNAVHRVLVETFGTAAPKPFRLMEPKRKTQSAVLYGYTQEDEEHLKQRARAFADPLQALIIPPESIQTKKMPDQWEQGQVLAFNIRVRPIIRSKAFRHIDESKDSNNPPHVPELDDTDISEKPVRRRPPEHDAYIVDNLRRRQDNLPPRDSRTVYSEWLKNRLDTQGGASLHLDSTTLLSLTKSPSSIKNPGDAKAPEVVIQGTLTVQDPDAFAILLANGTGRHKTYGYGMLLLRAIA